MGKSNRRKACQAFGGLGIEKAKRVAGATPKLTRSARESRSLPTGDCALSQRATAPSNTSNSAAARINKIPAWVWSRAKSHKAKTPQARFPRVSALGMAVRILKDKA